jgi:hypothetical protein
MALFTLLAFSFLGLISKPENGRNIFFQNTDKLLTNLMTPNPRWQKNKQTPWFESTRELYRPSDRRLSAK